MVLTLNSDQHIIIKRLQSEELGGQILWLLWSQKSYIQATTHLIQGITTFSRHFIQASVVDFETAWEDEWRYKVTVDQCKHYGVLWMFDFYYTRYISSGCTVLKTAANNCEIFVLEISASIPSITVYGIWISGCDKLHHAVVFLKDGAERILRYCIVDKIKNKYCAYRK